MSTSESQPTPALILTLELDPVNAEWFDAQRRQYFPPERNFLRAHLTMFHQLPGERLPEISARLLALAAQTPPPALLATGVRSLGRGVAYVLESAALQGLRGQLAGEWKPFLSPQDRQGFRPHVTVQNKVTPEAARELHARLAEGFVPFSVQGVAMGLWRYVGGPWEAAGSFPFATS